MGPGWYVAIASPATILGGAALLLAAVNVAGGFLVTQRMLKMFTRSTGDGGPEG